MISWTVRSDFFSIFLPFITSVLWPFIFAEGCDILKECIISGLTKTKRLFLVPWQCRLAVSWTAFPFAQHGPKGREPWQPSLCWAARFGPITLTLQMLFHDQFLGAIIFILVTTWTVDSAWECLMLPVTKSTLIRNNFWQECKRILKQVFLPSAPVLPLNFTSYSYTCQKSVRKAQRATL